MNNHRNSCLDNGERKTMKQEWVSLRFSCWIREVILDERKRLGKSDTKRDTAPGFRMATEKFMNLLEQPDMKEIKQIIETRLINSKWEDDRWQ